MKFNLQRHNLTLLYATEIGTCNLLSWLKIVVTHRLKLCDKFLLGQFYFLALPPKTKCVSDKETDGKIKMIQTLLVLLICYCLNVL